MKKIDTFTILLVVMGVIAAGMNFLTYHELRRVDALQKERAELTEQARTLYAEKSAELETVATELAEIIGDARKAAMIADATPESEVPR